VKLPTPVGAPGDGGRRRGGSGETWCETMLEPECVPGGLYRATMSIDPFGESERRYRELVARRRQGELDVRAFRAAVRQLRVRDADGREWSLGPSDGRWYRRERDLWQEAEPPRRLLCPTCGHPNLQRHSFCTQCGAALPRPEPALA
jgi:hypothetical protein